MFGKGSKLYSIVRFKCPRCHEGDLFVHNNPYKFKGFFDMPERCPVCGQKYEMETGFFYGAMYVSYALTIAISVALWIGIDIFTDISWLLFFVIDISVLFLISPVVFKLSRAIWINFFIHYGSTENIRK